MEVLFSKYEQIEDIQQHPIDIPFSDAVIHYLNALSGVLMKNPLVRQFPDVVTFAFFCRKANIKFLSQSYDKNKLWVGRGVAFHIAPSNVPVNFAYSLISGLLSGNTNIVRIPSKKFTQVELIVEAINTLDLTSEFSDISKRIVLLRYERGGKETDVFSKLADVRVIWGGDETISQIRQSPLPARSFDIAFADRYSFCVIDAENLLQEQNLEKLVEGFYNDTYLFDQNACSAPHLVVWIGEQQVIKKAQDILWEAFYQYEKTRYKLEPILAVDKLTAFYRQAIHTDIEKEKNVDNSLWRVKLNSLNTNIDIYRCAGGYFSEYSTKHINDIAHIVNKKYQTMAYYGFDNEYLSTFVIENKLNGIDRIVPIGKTTDFALVWDGYDLIQKMSREITII